ncbi:hypothetical protein [Thiolapillus sp.]
MSIDIYISFTRYQLQAVNNIFIDRNSDTSVLITTIEPKKSISFDHTFIFDKLETPKSLAREINQRKRLKAFRKIKSICEKHKHVNVFIPHFFNINTNYVALTLLPDANIYIYPDGLLSYYPYRISKRDMLKQSIYKGISFLVGLRYRIIYSYISNPLDNIKAIYSYEPEITYKFGRDVQKITEHNLLQHNTEKLHNLIILGTSGKVHSPLDLSRKIQSLVSKESPPKVFYKMHPSCDKDSFFTLISKAIPETILIKEKDGIEHLIQKYRINTMISTEFSTALIECKRLYGSSVTCYLNKNATSTNKYSLYFKDICEYYDIADIE